MRKRMAIMKKLFLMLLIIIDIIQLCQTTFAAKILLEDGNQFPPGEIIGIQGKTVLVKTEFGNLTADFSKIDTILFDETADPLKPGIQFTNGDIITGELETLKDHVLTIKMKYGLYIVQDINATRSVNFVNNSDLLEYTGNTELNALFYLNQYECVYGQLLAIEDNIVVVNSIYGTLKIEITDIERMQFTEDEKISNVKFPIVLMKNNDKIEGKPISFKDEKFHIQTNFGEAILTNPMALAIITLGENEKRAKSISNTLSMKDSNKIEHFRNLYTKSSSVTVYFLPVFKRDYIITTITIKGTALKVLDKREDWYKIRTPGGDVGWVGARELTNQ